MRVGRIQTSAGFRSLRTVINARIRRRDDMDGSTGGHRDHSLESVHTGACDA